MFFHTNREIELAKVFGITDCVGITLVNQAHPYPYLVEQEEKYHGIRYLIESPVPSLKF